MYVFSKVLDVHWRIDVVRNDEPVVLFEDQTFPAITSRSRSSTCEII